MNLRGVMVLVVMLGLLGIGVWGVNTLTREDKKQDMTTEISGDVVASITPAPTPTPVMPTLAAETNKIVKFVGDISVEDKNQLIQRVVNPFIDYYAFAGQGELISLTVSVNTKTTASTYPYSAEANFDNGVSIGVAIEKKVNGLAWWYPECLMPCKVSQEYIDKYPEVAKNLGY